MFYERAYSQEVWAVYCGKRNDSSRIFREFVYGPRKLQHMLWNFLCYHVAVCNKNGTEIHTQLMFHFRWLEALSYSGWARTWAYQLLRNTEKIARQKIPTEVSITRARLETAWRQMRQRFTGTNDGCSDRLSTYLGRNLISLKNTEIT